MWFLIAIHITMWADQGNGLKPEAGLQVIMAYKNRGACVKAAAVFGQVHYELGEVAAPKGAFITGNGSILSAEGSKTQIKYECVTYSTNPEAGFSDDKIGMEIKIK